LFKLAPNRSIKDADDDDDDDDDNDDDDNNDCNNEKQRKVLQTFTEAGDGVQVISSVAGITLHSGWICLRRNLTRRAAGRTLCQ